MFIAAALLLTAAAVSGFDPSNFTVKPRGLSGDVYSLKSARYIICSASENFSVPENSGQKVMKIFRNNTGGASTCIDVESGSREFICDGKSGGRYLADTSFLNYESPLLKKKAEDLLKEKNKTAVVENFVYRHISDKRYGIPLIPADMVYEKKAGDCTEHAVLAGALLRGAGVPARAVVGLILEPEFMGLKNVFVFHMWNEACVSGKWTIVDATRPGNKNANRYIALAYHNLRTAAPLDYIEALSALDGLTVEYLSGR